ncbi:membrane-associated progesterone receptor component 1 [Scaptodrosophila lebanonensis]|uniref:Membrane-associated progesterone receptor component 1 n=1 Tax=Drosophila lebanonensis TaxID=7225 RepID=A0A6J2TYX6_DROLE|nr:membrane-associated progesterone receptor component 1 [Scaptodrosophila lebanonensis]XP_030381294.1 membrane-associated progesterone receptor component 1 [Scaptodrosophila lebanonensis]
MAEIEKDLLRDINSDVDGALGAADNSINGATGGDELKADAMVESSFLSDLLREIFYSPMNLALLAIICFLVYKIVRDRTEVPSVSAQSSVEPALPKLRRDFTVQELRSYDGNQPDGRVLVAVNGNVYDVTKGKRFYGPGGPYATFAGRDASRNLATFSVAANEKDDYDDLSDLNAMEMDSVNEWEMQFKEKYEFVGKLLRKGEQPSNYDDDEEDENISSISDVKKQNENINNSISDGQQKSDDLEKLITNAPAEDATLRQRVVTGSHITLGASSTTNIADSEANSTDC